MQTDLRRLLVTGLVTLGLAGATWSAFQGRLEQTTATPATAASLLDGEVVFLTKGCTGCHSRVGVPGSANVGPNLTALATRAGTRVDGLAAEEYVRQALLEPQSFLVDGYFGEMPTLSLSEREVDALIEFLLSS